MSELHEISCTCYLWPWMGPPSTTMQYVMYFRFVDYQPTCHSLAAANALVRRFAGIMRCLSAQCAQRTSAFAATRDDRLTAKSAIPDYLVTLITLQLS